MCVNFLTGATPSHRARVITAHMADLACEGERGSRRGSEEQEEEVCAICCDRLSDEATSPLECGHAFHTRCVLTHLQRLGSFCPLCRHDPRAADDDEHSTDDDGGATTMDEADVFEEILSDATIRDELRQRPEYRHHFETLDRWTAVSAQSRRTLRGVTSTLRHGEDLVRRDVHRYRMTRYRNFRVENHAMYESARRCESTINRAEAICRRTRHVMFAKVFGRRR